MQGVPEILSNCLKNNTQKDPQDSFKLNTSKPKQEGFPRFFQTTSKTRFNGFPTLFQIASKIKQGFPRFFYIA